MILTFLKDLKVTVHDPLHTTFNSVQNERTPYCIFANTEQRQGFWKSVLI